MGGIVRRLSNQALLRSPVLSNNRLFPTTGPTRAAGTPARSWFTSSSTTNKNSSMMRSDDDDHENNKKGPQDFGLANDDDAFLQRRHNGILMDPAGYSARILPGGQSIIKVNKATGEEKKVLVERFYGHFWMIKDLRLTNNKPIMPNTSLIPPHRAKVIPSLPDLCTLVQDSKVVSLPNILWQEMDTQSDTHPTTKEEGCTLLAISFKQFGFDMLSSWIVPFQQQVVDTNHKNSNDIKVINLHITLNNGLLYKYIIQPMMLKKFRATTRQEDHKYTLLHFGPDPEAFRDALRMHNTLTGYVALLDSLGRVRWMSSGMATEEELTTLIQCAKELCHNNNMPVINV
jgi:ATPase complex subunit ATP10